MTPGGRTSAAIEILADVLDTGRPASEALREWGRKNRYAGSSDRAAIGNLLYAVLRRKLSLAAAMGTDDPRSLILGALRWVWGEGADAVARICDGEGHAPAVLSEAEAAALAGDGDMPAAPEFARADVPEWLWPEFVSAFGSRAGEEGRGLATRPPVDIRVNTLQSSTEKLTRALARHQPAPGGLLATCLRFETPEGPKRHPNLEAETSHGRGHFEVQDQGSQIAAALAGARAGMQVVD
ncbi:Sun protein, partial [hydrothermal vent metagenome]